MRKKYVAGIVLLLGVVIVAAGVLFFYRYKNTEEMSGFPAFYEPTQPEDVEEENGIFYDKTKILVTATDDAEYSDINALARSERGTITGYISDTNDYQIKFTDGRTYQELEEVIEG